MTVDGGEGEAAHHGEYDVNSPYAQHWLLFNGTWAVFLALGQLHAPVRHLKPERVVQRDLNLVLHDWGGILLRMHPVHSLPQSLQPTQALLLTLRSEQNLHAASWVYGTTLHVTVLTFAQRNVYWCYDAIQRITGLVWSTMQLREVSNEICKRKLVATTTLNACNCR